MPEIRTKDKSEINATVADIQMLYAIGENMKTILTTIIILTTLISARGQILIGKIFELGADRQDCKIYAECDCCTSDLFFINENQFVLLDYCTFETTATTGTFKLTKDLIQLTFNQVSVTSGQDYTDDDSTPYITKDIIEMKPLVFLLTKCEDGELMLENKEFMDYKFGLRTNTNDEDIRIISLLNSDTWETLIK